MKWLGILLFSLFAATSVHAGIGQGLERIPIQDAGRIKPFGTFAGETLQLIYGKKTVNGKPAAEVVFTWVLIPEHWFKEPLIELRHKGLKEALQITTDDRYYSAQSLFANPRIGLIFQELQTLRGRGEKLNPYFQSVARLESQLALFQAIRGGTALRFVPDPASDTWKSVADLEGEPKQAFSRIIKAFAEAVDSKQEGASAKEQELNAAIDDFIAKARAQAPEKYADSNRIQTELRFMHFHPFQWAWIAYLTGLVFLFFAVNFNWSGADWVSRLALWAGFGLHAYGMAVRVYLAGRPPVSNMYETVVWVPWGCVLFGLILERVLQSRLVLVASAAVAVFCLILTDLAPTILDASIQPLEPVLRSTFWLSTHVLIITISYAAFFLAFAVGDVLLYYFLKDEQGYAHQIHVGVQAIYRALQIGVVLLAFGIILGGIWADYSWGRFWGWDPKETWALIALLGYLALLHGRLVGWVKNFQLAAGSVLAFSLVIMAWYGVNMVLGAGLHTYGFGAGGIEYVGGFLALQIFFVTYVSALRYYAPKNTTR